LSHAMALFAFIFPNRVLSFCPGWPGPWSYLHLLHSWVTGVSHLALLRVRFLITKTFMSIFTNTKPGIENLNESWNPPPRDESLTWPFLPASNFPILEPCWIWFGSHLFLCHHYLSVAFPPHLLSI
jgi:hypothetical protein